MNCSNVALRVGQYDTDGLYKYVLERYLDVKPENVRTVVAISNNELVLTYKNGKREIFDFFEGDRQDVPFETDAMTEEQHRKQFPKQLRKWMRRRFVDQVWLAKEIDVTQGMVSKYLTGKAIPGYAKLKRIAIALRCTVDDLYLNIPSA